MPVKYSKLCLGIVFIFLLCILIGVSFFALSSTDVQSPTRSEVAMSENLEEKSTIAEDDFLSSPSGGITPFVVPQHALTLNRNGGRWLFSYDEWYEEGFVKQLPTSYHLWRYGYTLLGWREVGVENALIVTEVGADRSGDLEFVAVWQLDAPILEAPTEASLEGVYDGKSGVAVAITVNVLHPLSDLKVSYRWYKPNGGWYFNPSNELSDTYIIRSIGENGKYYCEVTVIDADNNQAVAQTMEYTVTVLKREVTVQIRDYESALWEPLQSIDYDIVEGSLGLGDVSAVLDVRMSHYTDNTTPGLYEINGISNSENYIVTVLNGTYRILDRFDLILNANGGEWQIVPPTTYVETRGLILPMASDIERGGYEFVGWTLSGGDGSLVTEIAPESIVPLEFDAVWQFAKAVVGIDGQDSIDTTYDGKEAVAAILKIDASHGLPSAALGYQWWFKPQAESAFEILEGAVQSFLEVRFVNDSGLYYCVVTAMAEEEFSVAESAYFSVNIAPKEVSVMINHIISYVGEPLEALTFYLLPGFTLGSGDTLLDLEIILQTNAQTQQEGEFIIEARSESSNYIVTFANTGRYIVMAGIKPTPKPNEQGSQPSDFNWGWGIAAAGASVTLILLVAFLCFAFQKRSV